MKIAVTELGGAKCLLDWASIILHISMGSAWAMTMRDASATLGSGQEDMELDMTGLEEECYEAHIPESQNFDKQYCVITFHLPQVSNLIYINPGCFPFFSILLMLYEGDDYYV